MPIADFLFDPVTVHAVAAAIGIILISGAINKLRDVELFRYAVEDYGIIEGVAAAVFAGIFPLLELAAGVAIVFEPTRGVGQYLGFLVLGIATGGVVLALMRGMRVECGCGQGAQRISWGLVLRNILLCTLLALGAAQEHDRSLVLIDYFSVAGIVLSLLAVYASANQLLANQPLLKELRS